MVDRLRSKWGIVLLVLVILILIVTVGGFKFHLFDSTLQSGSYSDFQDIHASDRILIFVPHPDDESLGTSGIIREALEKNATILLVFMTNGDAYTPDFLKMFLKQTNQTGFKGNIGELRHLEAVNATRDLGLNDNQVIFLGYPDGGLKNLFEDNWDYDHLFKKSTGSNLFDHSPYNFSYEVNAPYCGANVDKNVEQIIINFKPNMIFYPDDGDDHTDHWATSAFVRYAAVQTNYTGSTYCYLVHKGFQWPQPSLYAPDAELLPPTELLNLDATWMILPLSKTDENLKAKAINAHKSQLFATKDYLNSFIRTDEIYSYYPIIEIEKLGNNSSDPLNMPKSSFKDVKNDQKTKLLQQADDLTSAGLAYTNSNMYLYLGSSSMQNNLVYNFHLKIFNSKDFKRIDVTVKNGKAQYESKANNSITSNETPEVNINNNVMRIKLPLNLFNGAKYVLMSTDVSDTTGNNIDTMALRMFKFPNTMKYLINEIF